MRGPLSRVTPGQAAIVGVAAVLLYEAPFFVLGDRAHLPVHDVLDSTHALYATFFGQGRRDEAGGAPFLLGGLPAAAISPTLEAIGALYTHLPPLWAFRANDVLIRLVALAGMFSLLKALQGPGSPLMMAGVSIAFALSPFWTPGGLSVAGLPVIALAALRLWRPRPGSDSQGRLPVFLAIGALALFPTYSSLALVGVFLIPTVVALGFFRLFLQPRSGLLLAGAVVLAVGFVVTDWPTLRSQFGPQTAAWHREEFAQAAVPQAEVLRRAVEIVVTGHYHASANSSPVIWLSVLIALLIAGMRPASSVDPRARTRLAVGVAAVVTSGVWYWIYFSNSWLTLGGSFRPLAGINLSRTYFLLPPILYVIFHQALVIISGMRAVGAIVCGGLLCLQMWVNVHRTNWSQDMISDSVPQLARLTYREYVSARAFDVAERVAGEARTKMLIACLGFFPAVANLNGFDTVDGYVGLYPLEYKHRFRKVIAPELEKSESLRQYFDNWGSRAYLMSSELGTNFYVGKHEGRVLHSFQIDSAALRDLGASHLFSAVSIDNSARTGLLYLGRAQDSNAGIDIYVYAVAPNSLPASNTRAR
jgi:hypothetical protein